MQYNNIYILILLLFCSCTENVHEQKKLGNNTSIYKDKTKEVLIEELIFEREKGLLLYNEDLFTGIAVKYYSNDILKEKTHYLNGVKDGSKQKWFESGLLSFETTYEKGIQNGTATSWWKNGNPRSKAHFDKGVVNGTQYQWYKSGSKFKEINIVDGKEEGMQRSWRENGKIYNNYEARNGRIFGLKRSKLCFKLNDETLEATTL